MSNSYANALFLAWPALNRGSAFKMSTAVLASSNLCVGGWWVVGGGWWVVGGG